jgi:hypothetical protein
MSIKPEMTKTVYKMNTKKLKDFLLLKHRRRTGGGGRGWRRKTKPLGPPPQFVDTASGGMFHRTAPYLTFYMQTVINRNVETGSGPKSL